MIRDLESSLAVTLVFFSAAGKWIDPTRRRSALPSPGRTVDTAGGIGG